MQLWKPVKNLDIANTLGGNGGHARSSRTLVGGERVECAL